MKKLLIFLIIFSSIFLFSDKVYATHNNYGTLDINTENIKLENLLVPFDEFIYKIHNGTFSNVYYDKYDLLLNKMITDSESTNLEDFKNNYEYIITFSNDVSIGSNGYYGVWFPKNNDVVIALSYLVSRSGGNVGLNFALTSLSNTIQMHYYHYAYDGTNYNENSISTDQVYINSSNELPFFNKDTMSPTYITQNNNYTKTSLIAIPDDQKQKYIYYDTNMEINIIYQYHDIIGDYFKYLTFNNDTTKKYVRNDIISGHNKWISDLTYEYEDTIHVHADENSLGISKIIFDFKIPDNLNYRDTYDFELDIEADGQHSDESTPKPYLTYGSNYNDEFINQVIDVLDSCSEYEAMNQVETYVNCTGSVDINMIYHNENDYIRMIIDFGSMNFWGDYYLKFESTLDYEISYITKDEEWDYWAYIDMHNKYGLYLIPKVLNNDLYITMDLLGEYKLYYLENYNDPNSHVIDYGIKDKSFTRIYNFNNLNQALKFENTMYGKTENDDHYIDDTYWNIRIDTRYFNYVVLDTPYNNEEIINPNTNEKTTTSNIDEVIKTSENYEVSTDDFFKIINQANKNNGISNIINDIYNTIRKDYKLGTYFLIIIVSSIILLVLKSLKR